MTRKIAFLCLTAGLVLAPLHQALAFEPPERESRRDRFARLQENVGRLIGSFQMLGNWDEHYGYMMDALENVYVRNNWNTESDMFSLGLIAEVGSIPPWQVNERFERFVGIMSDRYMLDESQERIFRHMVIRNSNDLFEKHSGRILQYAVDAIQTRASGEPFTAEKVARWAELAEPVFHDSWDNMNRLAGQLMERLDADQRERLERDLEATNRRLERMDVLRESWERGEWKASDWGIENDPIQLAGERRRAEEARQAVVEDTPIIEELPGKSGAQAQRTAAGSTEGKSGAASKAEPPKLIEGVEGADDEWARYTREFIKKYVLTESQQHRAWQVYRDAARRRDRLKVRYGEQIAAAERRVIASDTEHSRALLEKARKRQGDAIDRLFEQFKRRLDRLPTAEQREEAKKRQPEEEPSKVKKPVNSMEQDGP